MRRQRGRGQGWRDGSRGAPAAKGFCQRRLRYMPPAPWYVACLMAVVGRQLNGLYEAPAQASCHVLFLRALDFNLLATAGETNCETLPPIMAICRTSVPVMCRTAGLAGRNTVSMSGAIAAFVPAICIS